MTRFFGPVCAAMLFASLSALTACSSGTISQFQVPTTQPSGGPARSTIVTNVKDAGPGSLRSAIQAANATGTGTTSTISFKVDGTIALASDLPPIHVPVKIDGTTAPKYAGGAPKIEINAHGHHGLVFEQGADGSQLLGLSIVSALGNGVILEASSITVNLNYIGLTLTGQRQGNTDDGVSILSGSSNNFIGLNPKGASGVIGNVISGNGGNGISLHGTSGNTIVANRIGTNPSGTSVSPNALNGMWITGASHDNEIGGTIFVDSATGATNDPTGDKGTVTPVFVVPPLGNLISGNELDGILVDNHSIDNNFNGNFIGTTADGDGPLGNTADGVHIFGSDANVLAGCKFVNNPFVYYNVSSGNGLNGVHITNSNDVIVQGNFFGIGANNTVSIPNQRDGILVDGSSRGTQVGGVIPLGNVSAGNGRNGIEVVDTASFFTTFNTFGGLLAFKGAAPNGNDGLLLTATGGHQDVRTNVFSGNANNGIEIGGDASGVTIEPDIVGLTTKGNAILANGGDGLLIGGTAHGVYVGGDTHSVIPQDTFSGNGGYGIEFAGHAHDNTVVTSFVGTNVAGNGVIPNGRGGIFVGGSATHDSIGGSSDPTSALHNLVSGNAHFGAFIDKDTSFISVIGNWFGLDRTGHRRLGHDQVSIVIVGSSHDTISGNINKPQK
jgi:parallel beta-helix repeat protein